MRSSNTQIVSLVSVFVCLSICVFVLGVFVFVCVVCLSLVSVFVFNVRSIWGGGGILSGAHWKVKVMIG